MSEIDIAREKLRRALVEGRDTAAIRREIERRQAEEAEAARQAEKESTARATAAFSEIAHRADAIAAAFEGEVRGLIDRLQPPESSSQKSKASRTMHDVSAFAHQVAEAERGHADSTAALAASEAEVAALRGRVRDLMAERAGIVARRVRGEVEKSDAGQLALIVADVEGLEAIVAEAEGRAAVKRTAHAEAVRNLVLAKGALVDEQRRIAREELIGHADRLGQLLLATLVELDGPTGPTDPRTTWLPPEPLWRHLRKGIAVAGRL